MTEPLYNINFFKYVYLSETNKKQIFKYTLKNVQKEPMQATTINETVLEYKSL